MTNQFLKVSLTCFVLLWLLACRASSNIPTPTPEQGPAGPDQQPALAVALPLPTPATPQLAAAPTSPLPTLTPSPAVVAPLDDLTLYRQAMRPAFTMDVDLVAAAGATRYQLEVRLEPDSFNEEAVPRLHGVAQIRYTNTEPEPLSEIYFRLYPNLPGYGGQMTVETVRVGGQPVVSELASDQSALRAPLAQPLLPGATVEIELTYNTLVPRQTGQGYNIFSYTDGTLALAGFYPAIAVYDEEGWNIEIPPPYGDATYLDVSLYQVELTVPEAMVVAASGSLLNEALNGDGTKTLALVSGPMRDFYVAMRADYELVSDMVDGIVVNSYYPPDLASGGALALRYAVDALRVFNHRFGPYPYAEFDVVATPTLAGGVEYPGIVAVTQQVYQQQGGFFQHATVHEVAHQWWYGLVGNDQIDEPWLDESLTNYSTVIYWEEVEGQEQAEAVIDTFFLGPYQSARNQGRDRSVVGPVADFSEGEYGVFVYGKGPLFFNALRQEVGDETYFDIMKTYYTEYKYKIADSDDLLNVIERVSGRNVEPLVETWLQN